MTAPPLPCPSHAEIDRFAAEGSASDELLAHLAKCRGCAEDLAAARFGRRFGEVLAGHGELQRGGGAAMPEIFGYQLERELARGGQGVVYLATQLMTGQRVAIKVLPQASVSGHARARLLREIEIIATLHHPRIVRLLDSVTLGDGREALIMEYIVGEPLDRWRSARPDAPRGQVLMILSQVAEALHHAHQRGIIHRDLKPSNVVIDAEGQPCLLDFGIAARIGPDVLETKVTQTGEFTGTLTYAAPEQVRATGSAPDVRTDIYAMGVIAYEMLTGHPPYPTTGSLESVVRSILEASIPARSLAGLGADEWAVVAKAMSKDASRRYQSAAELAGDLRRAASGEAILARGDSRLYVLTMAAKRHRAEVGVALALVVGLVAVLGVLALSNARLRGALDESLLRQLHAHISAGERERAEAILWPALAGADGGEVDAGRLLWEGPLERRRMMWAFVEMQAQATCLSTDRSGEGAAATMTLLDDGSFGVLLANREIRRLRLEGERLGVVQSLALEPETVLAWYTPSCSHVFGVEPDVARCIDAGTEEVVYSVPLPIRAADLTATLLGERVVILVSRSGRVLVHRLADFGLMLELTGMMPDHRPFFDERANELTYLDAAGSLRVTSLDDVSSTFVLAEGVIEPTAVRPSAVISMPGGLETAVVHGSELYVVTRSEDGHGAMRLLRPGYRVNISSDPSGRYLAAAAYGNSALRLWDAATWQEMRPLSGHSASAMPYAFSSDSSRIVTFDQAGVARVWSLDGHGWKERLSSPTSRTHQVALGDGGRAVYLVESTGRVVRSGAGGADEELPGLAIPTAADASLLALSADGSRLARAGLGDAVDVFGLDGEAGSVALRTGGGVRTTGLQFDAAGGRLAVCTDEADFIVVDAVTGEELRRVGLGEGASASDLAWVDGRRVVVALRDGRLAVVEAAGAREPEFWAVSDRQVRAVASLGDGGQVYAIGDAGRVIVVDPGTGRCEESGRISEHSLFALAVHPSGAVLAVGDRSGRVLIVDGKTLTPMASFDAGGAVMSLEFCPSGEAVVVSALERPVERWELGALARTYGSIRPEEGK